MEFQSNDTINNTTKALEKHGSRLPVNNKSIDDNLILGPEIKTLFSGAISKYLKELYVNSGVQGNPKRGETLTQLETILNSLPLEIKELLTEYGNFLLSSPSKQSINDFVRSVLKDLIKDKSLYSQKNSELLNKNVVNLIKKAFSSEANLSQLVEKSFDELTPRDNKSKVLGSFKKEQIVDTDEDLAGTVVKVKLDGTNTLTQQRNSERTSERTVKANSPLDLFSIKQSKEAENKLKKIKEAETKFQSLYLQFTEKLRLKGVFLNIAKAYSSLNESVNDSGFYSDSPISLQDQDEKEQQLIAEHIFNTLKNHTSKEFRKFKNFLIKVGFPQNEISNIKKYFSNKAGNFPRDPASLLQVLLHPKQDSLYTGNKTASAVLNFRHLALKAFTQMHHTDASVMFSPKEKQNPGVLVTKINEINALIEDYNQFLEDNPSISRSKIEVKTTFNEITGGFVMFSAFTEEYQIAEADRQAATIKGEGIHKTTSFLQAIQAGLTSTIASQSDSNTGSYQYFKNLTQEQIKYLGDLHLVAGGKSVKEKYFSGGATGSTGLDRGKIQAIASELGAIIKSYEDKSQKVTVLLQDATEKRNIAASTLSKFLDKIYDVYKLTTQY